MADPLARAAQGLITAYRLVGSPVTTALGVRCRHEPSCSAYAHAAIGRHGLWLGGWMTIARLLRCRPGGSWGYDPAPERLKPGANWRAPWRAAVWRGPRVRD